MVAKNYDACEMRVLAHEGSEYTDGVHPYDPGGPTKWGITITDVRQFLKPGATADDVKRLTKQQAMDIYRKHYWAPIRGDDLPSGVDDAIYDYGINSGLSRVGKVVRRILGMSDKDWHFTDDVIAELRKRDPIKMINAICDERMSFLRHLAIWPTYARGWTTRVSEVRSFSTQLARGVAPLTEVSKLPADMMGKGTIAPPTKTTTTIGMGTAGTLMTGVLSSWHSITAHPASAIVIVFGIAIAALFIVNLINQAHAKAKDAPARITPIVPIGV